ncbi:MAG: adenine phosphoribosyltransferase [Actinomycetota bacterium]|nr:adenine phosphoribosyltransferase [Actinomycetota bacterium]
MGLPLSPEAPEPVLLDPAPSKAPMSPAPLTAPISEVVASRLREVPDFPVVGVAFKDFTPLLSDGPALRAVVQDISSRYAGRVDIVVGIEARGLILGAAVAYELGVGFVPVRKAGKLPGLTHRAQYDLEYGTAIIEVHADAFTPGMRALVMDDVLATGGTAEAACELVERAGATVEAVEVVLELCFLHGRRKLPGRQVHAILSLQGP